MTIKHAAGMGGHGRFFHPVGIALGLVSLAASILMAGCATTNNFHPPEPPGHGKALVYFIRDHFPPLKREAQLSINGEQVATIADDDFVAVNVPLGQNAILLTINGDKPFSFTLPVNREETMYLALSGNVSWALGDPSKAPHCWNCVVIDLTRHIYAKRLSKDEVTGIEARIHKKIG
jgi:hypothetical protein